MPTDTTFEERISELETFLEALFADEDALVDAVVADDWPRAMTRRGFEMHRETWDVEAIADALRRELSAVGGVDALDGTAEGTRLVAPEEITHIWPALPGAGVTPSLFAHAIGASQSIRASRRIGQFAERFVETWNDTVSVEMELLEADDPWWECDVVVVSGTDQTIDEVRAAAVDLAENTPPIVTGYGHRVSFAVVDDHDDCDLEDLADQLAADIVMWHQQGCFSTRAVLFCGDEERREELGEVLGAAIQAREKEWEATDLSDGELAKRAQARGTAEFGGSVFGAGLGFVHLIDRKRWNGGQLAPHSVPLLAVEHPDALADAVDVAADQLQGVALEAPLGTRPDWTDRLAQLGVTRICSPGELQQPPARWFHDGRPNVLGWLHVVTDE